MNIRQGNDYTGPLRIPLTFTDPDTGDPVDLSGGDIWFVIKRRRTTDDASAFVFKTTGDGIELAVQSGETLGVAYLSLDHDDTDPDVLPAGTFWYAAQATDSAGRIFEVGPDRVTVERELIAAQDLAS